MNVLGKTVGYPQAYCPEILVAVPRSQNREVYGIDCPDDLFCGYDSWHAYEASFLLDNGMPVIGALKIVYPSASRSIVESKSLKLYLGSFHMTRLGPDRPAAIGQYTERIRQDLSQLLATPVEVCFYEDFPVHPDFDFTDYRILERNVRPEQICFTAYQETPDYLYENMRQEAGEIRVGSHLLKSNCKITRQPDWGSIYIRLKAACLPHEHALLKYIVSLRNENHFHEEICEMTFKRLSDLFNPEILMVSCLYTRRGGIDICPARANSPLYLPSHLIRADNWTQRSFRQ